MRSPNFGRVFIEIAHPASQSAADGPRGLTLKQTLYLLVLVGTGTNAVVDASLCLGPDG